MKLLNKSTLQQASADAGPNDKNINAGVGIVHLGFGAFHRAHQALITDTLLKEQGGDWKIVGVNNWRAAGKSFAETGVESQFSAQDNLYSVAVGQDESLSLNIVGAIEEVLYSNQVDKILDYMTRESVKVVTLTITEKGYCHFPATGRLNLAHPLIKHDLQHLDQPQSAIGFLVAAIKRRRALDIRPFTPLSCDNLLENGQVLKQVVLDFSQQLDPELHDWIEQNIAFPSSMVDRIVPQTSAEEITRVQEKLGLLDQCCVVTEPFLQWVIEDNFNNDRPAWEKCSIPNILLTADVVPFENMKLRLLNGTHSAMAYLGYLSGYQTISETIDDPLFKQFIRYLMDEEITPSLTVVGIDLNLYKDQLITRYQNSALKHRTWQIAMDGSQKIAPRFLQTIIYDLQHDISNPGLYLALAAWIKYVSGIDEQGETIDVRDPLSEIFAAIWSEHQHNRQQLVEHFLALDAIFPAILANHNGFKQGLVQALGQLLERGAKQSVYDFVGQRICH